VLLLVVFFLCWKYIFVLTLQLFSLKILERTIGARVGNEVLLFVLIDEELKVEGIELEDTEEDAREVAV
jgi:hypothetical protein